MAKEKKETKGIKGYLNKVFIDGFSGMALGLFATLIIGTIVGQIAGFVGGTAGLYMKYTANIAKSLMGAGIGVGVASKFKEGPLVTVSAAVAGMIGAFPTAFIDGVLTSGIAWGAPGNPLSAFIAAYVAIEAGHLVSGKTPVDIIVTPIVSIATGAVVAYVVGPYIAIFTEWLGNLININVDKHPFIGGIVISVSMGIFLTLPISSAAIGIMLGLSGLADNTDDKDKLLQEYETISRKAHEEIMNSLYENQDRLDIRSLKQINTSMKLLNGLAKKNNFFFPCRQDGKEILVNLKVVESGSDKGSFQISFNGEKYGKISIEGKINQNSLNVNILSDNSEALGNIQKKTEMLEEKLADFNNVNITTGKSDEIPEIQAKINENVSTEKLFKTAKIFILEFAN